MEKKSFRYRNTKTAVVWIICIGLLIIGLVPAVPNSLSGIAYYALHASITIGIVYVLWHCIDLLPGVNKKGLYIKENGVTRIEFGNRAVLMNQVNKLILSDKRTFSRGVTLTIQNGKCSISFLSEPLSREQGVEDSSLYPLFTQLLAENNSLTQEKDISGESIKYWYKA